MCSKRKTVVFKRKNEYPSNWDQISDHAKSQASRCAKCKRTLVYLRSIKIKIHTHHKKELSHGGSNKPTNFIVICEDCHKKEHKHMRKQVKFVKKFRRRK